MTTLTDSRRRSTTRAKHIQRTPWKAYAILATIAVYVVGVTIAVLIVSFHYGAMLKEYRATQEEIEVLTQAYINAGHTIDALQEELASYRPTVPEHSQNGESPDTLDRVLPENGDVLNDMSEPEYNGHVYTYLFNNDEERRYVERVVMQEAGNQPYEGMLAVTQCILNTCLKEGKSAYEVVTAPDQYASPYRGEPNEFILMAVSDVFDNGLKAREEPIMYFYSTVGGYVSKWHENSPKLEYVCTIEDHKFFKLKDT